MKMDSPMKEREMPDSSSQPAFAITSH